MANNWQINAIAGLDGTQSRNQLNSDIKGLARNLDKLKLYTEIDKNQVIQLQNQLKKLQIDLNTVTVTDAAINGLVQKINDGLKNIQIGNINVGNIGNQAQQVGQQIGNNIAQGVQSGVAKATTAMKSFSQLTDSMKSQDILFNNEGLQDTKLTLDAIKKTYSKFGQVKITNQIFNLDELQSFKVNIEQVNGELKETRSFMMSLSGDKTSFVLPDDVIKGTEKYVQHLNAAKNVINATGDEANALKQKLAEQEKYYGNIKKEVNTLYSLKTKLLSADELETAELEKQIKSIKQRITYNNQQIDKKGLRDNSLTREVNDLEVAKQKQLALAEARLQDSINAKSQVQSQKELNAALKEQQSLASQANKIQLSFANGDYEAKVESTIAKTQQWRDENGNARISTEQLRIALANLGTAYNNLNADGGDTIANQKALKQAESELSAEIKKVTNDVTKMNAEYAKSSKVESFHQKLTEFYDKNTATHRKWGAELKQMMDATASGAKVANSELLRMEQRYEQVVNEARQAGKLGLSFFDGIVEQAKKFTQWVSVTSVVMKGIRIGKDMIQDVRELDDSLLELTKVSDLSASGLEKVTEQAYELGEKVARTGKEVIDATTEFKRAGFDMQQSMDMAESAMVMTNVAENITDTADAAGTLISVLKGFNMDASETMTIVDKINQVSNTSPIGFDNIAEGLERTAGTMAQSGNTIDQTIGLITAGYAQLRNVEKVSTGLITLSARLRGVDEEGETIDGLSAKLQEDFGKIGVAIENADGSLRSIYEIAQDYSKVLPTLSDKQKQYYAELAAGKRQVTVWNAITQQFQDAEYAVNQSINSQNSALDENQKKLDSIGGHVKSFESAMEHLSSTVVESDLIKFFVDLGTTGVKAIDGLVSALTPLGTIGVISGGILGAKNAG